ncbi:hypothetical protein KAX35_06645, partial [candidate division WOR-3 bacterium]|nr:hypothetical protein [candidate division WOR-3 bacterium]
TFTGLDAGTYHTEAYKDNMFIGSAENVDVPDGVCQLVTITTLYKRNLEVKVCYKDGSTPIEAAAVKVYSWDGYNKKWDYEYKGTTNSQGKVTFSSWPTSCSGEKYKLVVEHNGYTKTKEPVYVNRDKGSSYTITMDDVGEEKPFISEVLLNRNPSIANLKCLHRAPNRAYSTALWYGDYRLEGLYAYVTIVNPTNKEFNGRLTWELMNCKREIVASGSGEGKLEIQPHTTKLTKLDIWRCCEWPVGFPSSGTYQLNITLREGELFGSNIDNKSIDMQLIDFSNEETPISYPMKDIDNDGKLEPVPGNEFYFFRKQDVDISGVDIIMMIIDFGIGLIIGEPPLHYTEIKRAELIKPGINTAKIALLDTGLKENTREITVKWWNVINELSGAGGPASWCANYDRAVITLEFPLSVEIVDDGGACYHNKDMDNQKQYLVYYEVGVDKCIKPVPYSHPDNPAKQYIIRIRSKSESLKNIQIRGTIGLEFGPFRDNLLKSQKKIYDYAKWQDHPEDVYWGIYGIDKAEINVNIPPPPSNKPDLVVTKFDIQPNPCHISDDVTVTFEIKNEGNADAGPHTEAFLTYSEHLPTHFFTCNGLKPGETKTFSFTKYNIQGPTGSFKFKVKADVYEKIPEWDEGNNIKAVNLEIKPEEKDTTPPETKCTLSPSSPNGEYGWYVTPVTVTLESTDDSSGIEWIKYYRIDSGSWQTYPGSKVSFTVSEDGGHRIIYYARDKAGNKEDLKFSPFFFIDTTNPSASISINNGAEYTNSRSVTLYLTYSDNMGVRDCRYKNEG